MENVSAKMAKENARAGILVMIEDQQGGTIPSAGGEGIEKQ
jgi:hypothetical protein